MDKKPLGILVDNLSPSQVGFLLTENINRYLENEHLQPITVFFSEQSMPCLPLKTARYHIKDAAHLYGNLISTSFSTTMAIRDFHRSKRFFYIQDLEWHRSWFKYPPELVINILKDPTIIKFTRSKDYTRAIEDEGFEIDSRVVEDFDIPQILEIVNDY